MIKSWWGEKQPTERRIFTGLAILTLCILCWAAIVKPIDNLIANHQSRAQKIKHDIRWMQDQAASRGLLRHPKLQQPLAQIVLAEAQHEHLAITLDTTTNDGLTIKPVSLPLDSTSRWLATLQFTHGITIDDFQFTIDAAGNDAIAIEHLSFRSTP